MKKFSIYTWKINMKFESNKFKFHLNYVIWRIHCESLSSAHQDQIPIIYGDSSHLISASLLLFKLKIQCKPESASLFCFVFFFLDYLFMKPEWQNIVDFLQLKLFFFYIFYLQIWPFMNWYLYNLYNGLIWMVLNSYSVVEITPISGLNGSKN